MKPLNVLILFALFTLAPALSHAQDRSMADATYALKGPVRTFRIEVAKFVLKDGNYVEGPRVVQMEASFNTDGNRTDFYIYDAKGLCLKRRNRTWIGSVQGAVATWSNHWSQESLGNIAC